MDHIVDNINKLELTFKTIDLAGRVPGTDAIEFLSVEEPYREGRRYSPFVRVRYALNGIKQDKAFPLDVDKGIFLTIDDDVLEEKLRPIAPKIVQILQEHVVQQNVERRDSIKMTLKEHIDDIRNQLKQGAFSNEAAVSFGIVQRLFEVLRWPKFTPQIIIPEYAVEGQRVDFALCHPPGKPLVFIEVKQVGNLKGAEEQLFGYAFGEGVPIAILTDGQIWRFFHATGEGKYKERKVYELDMIKSDSGESAERFDRYLNYEAVQKGDAVTAIKNDYQKVSKQREIEARLPEFWNELLQDKNEYLLLAVMEKVKSKVGYEPTEEQVLTFLKSLGSETVSDRKVVSPPIKSKPSSNDSKSKPSSSRSKSKPQRLSVTMPGGKVINHYHAKDTFVETLELLGLEEVMRVNPKIVRTEAFGTQRKDYKLICIPRGKYFINNDNKGFRKKEILENLATKLDIPLKVELTEKH